jgi:hypothetical protein
MCRTYMCHTHTVLLGASKPPTRCLKDYSSFRIELRILRNVGHCSIDASLTLYGLLVCTFLHVSSNCNAVNCPRERTKLYIITPVKPP